MVTTGKQPSNQNRLRKMLSVTWVSMIIRPLSGFRRFRNIVFSPLKKHSLSEREGLCFRSYFSLSARRAAP